MQHDSSHQAFVTCVAFGQGGIVILHLMLLCLQIIPRKCHCFAASKEDNRNLVHGISI